MLRQSGTLICIGMLISCAVIQPRHQEVELPPARIHQKGYSFVPLNEAGWAITQRNPLEVVMGKRGEGEDEKETYLIWGLLIELPPYNDPQELVRITREGQTKDVDFRRYRLITHEVTVQEEKGAECVRSHVLLENNAVEKNPGGPEHMMMEQVQLTCAHPKDKRIGINIVYSYRYLPEHNDASFIEKASSVVNSIEFEDL